VTSSRLQKNGGTGGGDHLRKAIIPSRGKERKRTHPNKIIKPHQSIEKTNHCSITKRKKKKTHREGKLRKVLSRGKQTHKKKKNPHKTKPERKLTWSSKSTPTKTRAEGRKRLSSKQPQKKKETSSHLWERDACMGRKEPSSLCRDV